MAASRSGPPAGRRSAKPQRRRPRRGSLERPVNVRLYRTSWVVLVVALLVAAFTVGRVAPLPRASLPPTFDQTTAVEFASELARRDPDRTPGGPGAHDAANWVAGRLADYRLKVGRQLFTESVPGLGKRTFVNLVAVIPGRTADAIVILAHRDNLAVSPGANDNASGTGALLELARDASTAAIGGSARAPLTHTLVFVSTDGGDYGGVGAERFLHDSPFAQRAVAVVNLDALAGDAHPRLEFAGDTPRSPPAALVVTASARILGQTGSRPARPSALDQLVDLAFPFTVYEQGPFVAAGVPAVTLTTNGDRPRSPIGDIVEALDARRLGQLGRSAQALVMSIDQGAEIAAGSQSYVFFGSRILRGWAIEFLLVCALIPVLAATVDLFARCRRRRISLAPALRSYRSRLGVWLWAGAIFALLTLLSALPNGPARPIDPRTAAATDWPVGALIGLCFLAVLGWLVARPRLATHGELRRRDALGGHLAGMLVLAVVALVVAAVNPYALLFVLPSLHAWLWLPHADDRPRAVLLYALGFLGPFVLVADFAFRLGLGLDAIWYLLTLVSVGFVPVPLILAALAWGAAAGQMAALAFGRYAPYPAAHERPARGPIRQTIRRTVLIVRRRRRRHLEPAAGADARSLEEQ